jgi:hypothetical protein
MRISYLTAIVGRGRCAAASAQVASAQAAGRSTKRILTASVIIFELRRR